MALELLVNLLKTIKGFLAPFHFPVIPFPSSDPLLFDVGLIAQEVEEI